MTRRRRLVVVAVALAILVALFLLSPRDDVVERDAATPRAVSAAPPPRAPSRHTEKTVPVEVTDRPDEPTETPPAPEPDGAELFPPLEVEVHLADGTWPLHTKAFAYALRPGDSGAGGPVTRVRLWYDGTCTLRLPEPGVYDIGAVIEGEFLWTLATDVDTRTTSHVALKMPKMEEVRFVRGLDLPDARGAVYVDIDDGQTVAETPGRGEVFAQTRLIAIEQSPQAVRAPPGVRLRIRQTADERTRARPSHFTAPATVTFGREDRGRFVVHASIEPRDRVARSGVVLSARWEVEGGGVIDRCDASPEWIIDEGNRISHVVNCEFEQCPPATHSTLRWKGLGILPGSVVIDVPDGAHVDVPVVLHLDESRPLPGEDAVALTVDGPHEAEDATLWELDAGTGGFHGPVASLGVEFRPEFAVSASYTLLASARGLASDPVAVERGGRAVLTLRPAGFLRVERGVHPPEGVALCVRRKDRLPFLGTADADQPWLFRDVVLGRPAVVIGPFPEGDVTFAVCYAGTDIDGLTVGTGAELCEFTAHVVAGTTTRVVLPLAQRLGAK